MKLYLDYIKLHFKSAIQYKISYILSIISQVFIVFGYYLIIISLFNKFNNVNGFTLFEVLLTCGIIHFGFSTNETFARGVDQFDELIIDGSFDILLLRPENILKQVIGYKIDFTKISRVVHALVIIIISLVNLKIEWSILKIITLILMMLSSIAIFFSIFLIAASYCFLTVQGLEVRNLLTDGGKHIAQYPIGIFNKFLVKIFTYIIPYALVNYYPLLYFIGKSNNIYYAFFPLIVLLYLIPSILIFNNGTKKYISTGS